MCIPSRMDFPSWFVFCKHFAEVVGFDRARLGKLTECVWEAKRAKQWIQLFRIPNDSSNVYRSLQRCHESNTLILLHPMQNFKTIVQLRNKILANEISWEFGYLDEFRMDILCCNKWCYFLFIYFLSIFFSGGGGGGGGGASMLYI